MKKNIFGFLTLVGISVASMSAVILLNSNKTTIKTDAVTTYTAQTLSTMNINCNDVSDSSIRSYYSSLNSLSTSERQGTNLLKNLKTILSNNVQYYSYADVTYITAIADRDWVNSPASTISSTYGTYDSATNTIKNYRITSAKNENPYIHMLYVDYDVQPTTKLKNSNSTSVAFDKEHIWPKSMGFKDGSNEYPGAFSDIHHLTSGDPSVNQNLHGNYSYGIVNGSSTVTPTNLDSRQGTDFDVSCLYNNKLGKALNTHSGDKSTSVFEPQDSDKGRIARACLYMVARYNNYANTTGEIGYYDPNLALVNYVTSTGSNVVSPSDTSPAGMGIMQDLLYWNKKFPPAEWEIHRNNLIYNNFQHNRNPFIDFPEWADYIWGTTTYSGGKYTYSSVTTGYATPSSDTINGYNTSTVTDSVSLNKTNISLSINDTATLTATSSGNVTWTSSNSDVVSVSSSGTNNVNATLLAKQTGSAIITAKVGSASATCNVTVTSDETIEPITPPEYSSVWPYYSDIAYRMYLTNTGTGTNAGNWYFTGSMSGYYGATSNSSENAIPMYFEESSGNHYVYFKSGTTKNYIYVVASGTHINFTYSSTDKSVFTYDSSLSTVVTDVNGTSYGLGTYSNYNTFGTSKTTQTTNYFAKFEFVNENNAYTFAANFLNNLKCDNGITAPSKSIWSSLSNEYSLLELGWKNVLKNAATNQLGTHVEQVVARYDYIVNKYGTSNYDDFMNRNVSSSSKSLMANNKSNENSLIFILIAVPTTLFGVLTLSKKRNSN